MLVDAGATIAGTVAAGLSGPGRFRYGGIRDFLLGVQFISGDGMLVFVLAPGAFIVLGYLIAIINRLKKN